MRAIESQGSRSGHPWAGGRNRFCGLRVEREFCAGYFLFGLFFRFVPAILFSSSLLIDSYILLEAPLRLDLPRSPRLADSAAPAAICCFFEVALGIIHLLQLPSKQTMRQPENDFNKALVVLLLLIDY